MNDFNVCCGFIHFNMRERDFAVNAICDVYEKAVLYKPELYCVDNLGNSSALAGKDIGIFFPRGRLRDCADVRYYALCVLSGWSDRRCTRMMDIAWIPCRDEASLEVHIYEGFPSDDEIKIM